MPRHHPAQLPQQLPAPATVRRRARFAAATTVSLLMLPLAVGVLTGQRSLGTACGLAVGLLAFALFGTLAEERPPARHSTARMTAVPRPARSRRPRSPARTRTGWRACARTRRAGRWPSPYTPRPARSSAPCSERRPRSRARTVSALTEPPPRSRDDQQYEAVSDAEKPHSRTVGRCQVNGQQRPSPDRRQALKGAGVIGAVTVLLAGGGILGWQAIPDRPSEPVTALQLGQDPSVEALADAALPGGRGKDGIPPSTSPSSSRPVTRTS